MNDERVVDWAVLPGEEVQIRKHGQNVRQGRVDAITGDASVLVIEASGASLRTLFEKSEGYTAWRRAEDGQIMPANSEPIADVRLTTAIGADQVLDAAHSQMIALAMLDGTKGVLLTRHSHRHYTFTLSNLVPFGQTQERTASSQNRDNAAGRPRSPEPGTSIRTHHWTSPIR